jgi:F420-dependent oxidoreductase-like protein
VQIHGDAIRIGLHAGQQDAQYSEFAELWQRSEALGYDWVSDFDHFRPTSGRLVGDLSGLQFEGPTILAALAALTSRVRCGILVAGVTYRHPAVAANIASTIDHISGGRLEWGIGAAWNEIEHEQLGIPFPRIGVRLNMLDEACRIMRGLWDNERFSFEGKHFRLIDAQVNPRPVQERLPLLLGGQGERRMLRIVAEHADIWNVSGPTLDAYRHKAGVLATHCRDVGRDPGDIRKSITVRAVIGEDASVTRKRAARTPVVGLPEATLVGTPQEVAEKLRAYRELGVADFLLNARAPFDWETIELFVKRVAPALRDA